MLREGVQVAHMYSKCGVAKILLTRELLLPIKLIIAQYFLANSALTLRIL